jgi:hypothetical protein
MPIASVTRAMLYVGRVIRLPFVLLVKWYRPQRSQR